MSNFWGVVHTRKPPLFGTEPDAKVWSLIIISEVVSDFRTTDELRAMFTLAAQSLARGGHLVINAFLAKPDYALDDAASELGQQCYTSIFTRTELGASTSGVPHA